MMKQERKAEKTPILLTEAETDHVAGGDGVAHAYAFGRKDGHPASTAKRDLAPGHD
jgi:hypothetical protein